MLRFGAEFIRLLLLLMIFGALYNNFVNILFEQFNIFLKDTVGFLLISLSGFILYFILYRNNLQFSGWFPSSEKSKLSKVTTTILIILSIVLVLVAPLFDHLP